MDLNRDGMSGRKAGQAGQERRGGEEGCHLEWPLSSSIFNHRIHCTEIFKESLTLCHVKSDQ